MLNRLFVVDSVTLTSTGTAVSSYTPWDQTTRKLPTQVVVKATGQGAYVRLSNDASAATNADVLVQGGDHVVLSVQGRRWVSVLSDGASSTVNVGALSTGVSGSAASLDLVFVDAGVLDPRVTFTRASTATYFNSAGVLTSAAINESRRDFDPATLAVRGLLIEEARTNSIRNNTMQGAVAGTPGTAPTNWGYYNPLTLSTQVVGTGVSNGITYVDIRVFGTAASSNVLSVNLDSSVFISASIGQTWTSSVWTALVGGTTTNVSNVQIKSSERDATNELGATATNLPLTGTLVRSSATRTFTAAATIYALPYIAFNVTAGAIDITLRIGLPQLEQGAFATSVIPTTTTALTRNADQASVNTLSPWFNATAGTVYSEFVINSTAPTSGFPTATSFNNGTINNRINPAYLNDAINALDYFVSDGGVAQVGLSSSTYTAGNVAKMAAAYATNDFALSTNGGAVLTDTSGTVPSVTAFNLGNQLNGNFLNGYLRRITYYPRRLSNAELVSITS